MDLLLKSQLIQKFFPVHWFQQQKLNLGRSEWDQARNYPRQNLQTLLGAVSGTGGYGSTTSPNPYQSSSAANALGGAFTGASIGNMINNQSGAGWGALVGGLGGLLLARRRR